MINVPARDDYETAKSVAESKGKKLSVICNAVTGNFLGYRLTSNSVRCHSERIVGIGKIRKLLGMDGWKYSSGVAIAVYPNNDIPAVINR